MNLFYRRPLSLILCILLGGFSLFAFLPSSAWPIIPTSLLPLAAVLIFKRLRRPLPIVAASALIISLSLSFVYFGLWFHADERFEDEVSVEAVITEAVPTDYGSVTVSLRTRSIDGAPFSRYKLRATVGIDEASSIRQGAVISFRCRLTSFKDNGSFDAASYYASRGFSAKATELCDIRVIGEAFVLDFSPLRDIISKRSILLSGQDAGALFTALFTGDRQYLSGNLALNFTRTGINHVLALSGAHLVILSVIVTRLLSFTKLGKKPRMVITAALAIFYVAMTGFSASVTRAGIMLAVAYGLFLLSSAQDSVTALSTSVFVICLVEPYAIHDIGLWLSAFATLGVIEAGELTRTGRRQWASQAPAKRLGRAALAGTLATLLATGATLMISVACFEGISPMTVVTTPLFSFLTEIYIYLGLVMLAIGELLPIGDLMRPFYVVIYELAEVFSKNGLAYFSVKFTEVKIVTAIFTVVLIGFIILKLRHKRIAASVVALALVSIFVTAGILTHRAENTESVIYYSADSKEGFVVRSDGEVLAVDISSGSALSHYDLLDAVTEEGLLALDGVVFTRYSSNLPDKTAGVLYSIYTRRVYLPRPENESERKLADEVELISEEARVEVRYYAMGGRIAIGDASLTVDYRVPYGEGTATTVMRIEHSGRSIAYLGSGTLADKSASEAAGNALTGADALILGRCGKRYSQGYVFRARCDGLSEIVMSGEGVTLTRETRIYYDEQGASFHLRPAKLELLP